MSTDTTESETKNNSGNIPQTSNESVDIFCEKLEKFIPELKAIIEPIFIKVEADYKIVKSEHKKNTKDIELKNTYLADKKNKNDIKDILGTIVNYNRLFGLYVTAKKNKRNIIDSFNKKVYSNKEYRKNIKLKNKQYFFTHNIENDLKSLEENNGEILIKILKMQNLIKLISESDLNYIFCILDELCYYTQTYLKLLAEEAKKLEENKILEENKKIELKSKTKLK